MNNFKSNFSSFSTITSLTHGYSTRSFGSMRGADPNAENNLNTFARSLGIPGTSIVRMHQVHGNKVTWVTEKNRGITIPQTDGLLTEKKQIFLSVIAADCIPLLFFDTQKEYIGVAHAGWRGLYSEIPKEILRQMKQKGSKPLDVIVGLGPCIHICCYEVSESLAKQFVEKFGKEIVQYNGKKVFIDLPALAKKQLMEAGLPEENIEDANICTAENQDKFFSYRKEGKHFGAFIGIIGML